MLNYFVNFVVGTLLGHDSETSTISEPVRSLGGGPKEFGPRGKGRSQLALVPRSVAVPAGAYIGFY